MKFIQIVLVFIILMIKIPLAFSDFQGEVVRIIDGDTIDVLTDKNVVRVRLSDIDAPESRQSFGQKSRQRLSEIIFRQDVKVIEKHLDRYRRILGTVEKIINDESFEEKFINVNVLMVKEGMAWAYRYRGKATNPEMLAFEKEAREKQIGLWGDPSAEEPWKWRRDSKKKTSSISLLKKKIIFLLH